MDDMDNILNGEEQPVTAAEPQQEPQAPEAPQEAEPASDGPNRGADGKFAPKGKDDAMPASEDEPKQIPIQSYQAEKAKRKEWEDRYRNDVETLRKELEALKQPKQPEAPPPTLWEDEQGWQNHFGQQITRQAVEAATYQSKLQMSEVLVSQQHEDFAEIKGKLVEFVGQNPAINTQVAESQHPWLTAYQAYKNFTTMQELGATDIESLKAQLMEQIKAEQAQAPAAPNLPTSLADAQSSRGTNTPAPKALSLEEILGR